MDAELQRWSTIDTVTYVTVPRVRFRLGLPYRLAMVLWLLAAAAFAAQRVWLLPILVVPLVFLAYALRAGVDADRHRLTVRALVGRRHVPWSDVTGFRVRRGMVCVLLTGGGSIRLPGVRADDLPVLTGLGAPESRAATRAAPTAAQ